MSTMTTMGNGDTDNMATAPEDETRNDNDVKPGLGRRMAPVFEGTDPGISDCRVLELKYLLRPDEVADILRISVSLVYELCAKGDLRFIKVRRSVRIKTDSVRHMLGLGRRP